MRRKLEDSELKTEKGGGGGGGGVLGVGLGVGGEWGVGVEGSVWVWGGGGGGACWCMVWSSNKNMPRRRVGTLSWDSLIIQTLYFTFPSMRGDKVERSERSATSTLITRTINWGNVHGRVVKNRGTNVSREVGAGREGRVGEEGKRMASSGRRKHKISLNVINEGMAKVEGGGGAFHSRRVPRNSTANFTLKITRVFES